MASQDKRSRRGEDRPNILFIMADQLRWDALGCTGGWARTPHLDALASEGILFSNAVTNSPVCIPARVSLASGLYPHNTGIWNNCRHTLDPYAETWMNRVQELGYRTSLFGKTHLHPHSGDLRTREHLLHAYGLDDVDEIGGPRASARLLSHMTARWERLGLWDAYKEDYRERFAVKPYTVRPSSLPLEEYADTYVGNCAYEYLEGYDRTTPWFCWVSFGGPHEPWDTPEPYASMYDPVSMPPPAGGGEGGGTDSGKDFEDRSNPVPSGVLDKRRAQSPTLTADDIRSMRADYAGSVTLIDEQIGRILTLITERGEIDNTLIVFTSDHGEMNGDHGLIYKSNLLDGAVRIPLIVRPPVSASRNDATESTDTTGRPDGAERGVVNTDPVELIDVGATILDYAGAGSTVYRFSRSLKPESIAPRDAAISELDGEYMLFDGRHKAAWNQNGELYLLFDCDADPDEVNNLVATADDDLTAYLSRLLVSRIIGSQTGRPFVGPV